MNIPLIISRIFDPFVMLIVICCLLFWATPQFIPALLLMIGLPFAIYVAAWRLRIISNWDITDRKERPRILWAVLVLELFASMVLKTPLLIPFLGIFAVFTIITHVWKISGHAMCVSLAAGMMIQKFGWDMWPVLGCVLLVSWARVTGKYHTVAQVTAGALYAFAGLLFASSFFP